jgi:hypothetical protein
LIDGVDVLDVLPEPVRDHPSVIPSALTRRLQVLERRGWPRADIRRRLVGIETADKPGAAAPSSCRSSRPTGVKYTAPRR